MLIDGILLLLVIFLVLSGYRRGLLMSLMGLLTVVVCCLGAALAQQTLTPRVAEYLQPKLESVIQANLEDYLADATQSADPTVSVGGQTMDLGQLSEFLSQFGIDMEETVTQGAETALSPVISQASAAIAARLVEKIAGALIFFAAYLILYLILHNVALAVNLVARLPVVHTLNRAGGAILGLLESLLFLTVAAAVLQKEGLLPENLGPISQILLDFAGKILG